MAEAELEAFRSLSVEEMKARLQAILDDCPVDEARMAAFRALPLAEQIRELQREMNRDRRAATDGTST
jgi:hypothetical protein